MNKNEIKLVKTASNTNLFTGIIDWSMMISSTMTALCELVYEVFDKNLDSFKEHLKFIAEHVCNCFGKLKYKNTHVRSIPNLAIALSLTKIVIRCFKPIDIALWDHLPELRKTYLLRRQNRESNDNPSFFIYRTSL